MQAAILGASIWGPGLEGWAASRPILAGEEAYVARDSPPPAPSLLSPNERRRTGPVVRLALAVAQEAAAMSGLAPGSTRSVFGSSNGDAVVVHDILEALSCADRPVSPTQFHNSVHNAAAGYWSIATGSTEPVTALGCHDFTLAASLLKAVAEVRVEGAPVLLCIYDAPIPAPLAAKRPTLDSFGAGLMLAPADTRPCLARIDVDYRAVPAEQGTEDPRQAALVALSRGNAAARILRLLEALARGEPEECSLAYLDGRLDITLTPCSPDPRS